MATIKSSVYIGTSLDGFIARKDGNIDWLVKFESTEIGESYMQFMENIDAHVIGRGTFEKVLTFETWPFEKKVFVLSNAIKNIPLHLVDKVEIIAMSPVNVLNYLSNKGFTKIYIDGGKVIQQFLQADCVDEMIITKIPVLLGDGISLFGQLEHPIQFIHVSTKVFSNGLVKCQYQRV